MIKTNLWSFISKKEAVLIAFMAMASGAITARGIWFSCQVFNFPEWAGWIILILGCWAMGSEIGDFFSDFLRMRIFLLNSEEKKKEEN